MARTPPRPAPTAPQLLQPLQRSCPPWGETLWAASPHYRTIPTLEAVWALTLPRRRCLNRGCPPLRHPYRPAPAGRLALPKHALGLDGSASMGPWRYADHRSIPAISPAVRARRGAVAPRPVTPRLERYDAWVALSLPAPPRLHRLTQAHGRVIFARDGLHPDVGQAVRGGGRAGRAGEGRLARSFLSATHEALAPLVHEGPQALHVPLVGGISDGPPSSRAAVTQALPGVPHQWGHGPARRDAAQPIAEAERHAKNTRQKRVRGLRPIARQLAGRTAPQAEVRRG